MDEYLGQAHQRLGIQLRASNQIAMQWFGLELLKLTHIMVVGFLLAFLFVAHVMEENLDAITDQA